MVPGHLDDAADPEHDDAGPTVLGSEGVTQGSGTERLEGVDDHHVAAPPARGPGSEALGAGEGR